MTNSTCIFMSSMQITYFNKFVKLRRCSVLRSYTAMILLPSENSLKLNCVNVCKRFIESLGHHLPNFCALDTLGEYICVIHLINVTKRCILF